MHCLQYSLWSHVQYWKDDKKKYFYPTLTKNVLCLNNMTMERLKGQLFWGGCTAYSLTSTISTYSTVTTVSGEHWSSCAQEEAWKKMAVHKQRRLWPYLELVPSIRSTHAPFVWILMALKGQLYYVHGCKNSRELRTWRKQAEDTWVRLKKDQDMWHRNNKLRTLTYTV